MNYKMLLIMESLKITKPVELLKVYQDYPTSFLVAIDV